jgi:hypothetical protein
MRKIKPADHLTDEELAELMELSENKQQFRRRQEMCLIQTQGLPSEQAAETVIPNLYCNNADNLYCNNADNLLYGR